MEYTKQPLSIEDQVQKLKSRGLAFCHEDLAKEKLASVSYYRLRAYTYPFQNNNNPNHPFVKPIDFDDIFKLYVFDHELRTLILNMLGVIEVAFRTQIIYQYSLHYGSHWHLNSDLYRDMSIYCRHMLSLGTEINRSTEVFIKHYHATYNNPTDPPCWMSLEVSSFGLLSQIFQNLKKDDAKREVALHFGISNVHIIENWLRCFSGVRNLCAHHSRLWNRRFTSQPTLPNHTVHPFISDRGIYTNKLYAILCCMLYILSIIRPHGEYKERIRSFVKTCPLNQLNDMGFPRDWEHDQFWR